MSGVPRPILERGSQLQIEHGSVYDMPFGSDSYRKVVVEKYWHLHAASGMGQANVLANAGGREGDAIVVWRVPWISNNWGP